MARVVLASTLSRWLPQVNGPQSNVAQPPGQAPGEVALDVAGANVGDALANLFARHPNMRGYVLDEHGAVRHHVALFVDGEAIRDKHDLSQVIDEGSEIYVMQALSGG